MKDTGIKFETLRKGFNFKKAFYVLLIIVIIGSVVILKGSKANYTYEQIIPFAEGEVHIKKYDFKIMAMYQQKDKSCTTDDCYQAIDRMPEGNFVINTTKSGCYKDSNKTQKDDQAVLKTIDGNHTIAKLLKEDKCYLYFDIATTKQVRTTLGTIEVNLDKPDFSKTSCSSGCGEQTNGIYEDTDDYGTTYYYRGTVDNNWVKFGKEGGQDIYWRIIRINGDGSIRMIYAGTGTSAPATTGDGTQLSSTSAFNSSRDKNAYVGYMYGTPGSTSYTEEHKNSTSSTIKGLIDNWYNTTTNLSELSTKLSHTAGFCGDRSSSTSESTEPAKLGGYGTQVTYYGAYYRNYKNKTPSFKCTYKGNDLYTTPSDESQGNKKLTYPIGLITADEVVFAGGVYGTDNKDFYLYTNQNYWTMSPSDFNGSRALVFFVDSDGWLNSNSVANARGVRPVINLSADTTFAEGGAGTTSNPYVPT